MRTFLTMISAALIFCLVGCSSPGPTHVPTGEAPPLEEPAEAPAAPEQQQEDMFQRLEQAARTVAPTFLGPEEAPQCPKVEVRRPGGGEAEVQPGKLGFITLIPVWSVDTPRGQALVQHASDLVRRYARLRVRSFGIVAKTANQELAPVFMGQQRIGMETYYDDADMSALRTLADAVGAEQESALPALFIVDRQLRLRFYRPGFQFVKRGMRREGRPIVRIEEDAPEDEKIASHLIRLLREDY